MYYIYVNIYIFKYRYTHIHMYMYTYTYIYIYMYKYVYICIYTYILMYKYVYIYIYIHIYLRVCIRVCILSSWAQQMCLTCTHQLAHVRHDSFMWDMTDSLETWLISMSSRYLFFWGRVVRCQHCQLADNEIVCNKWKAIQKWTTKWIATKNE